MTSSFSSPRPLPIAHVILCQQRSISISLRLSNLLPFHHEFLLSLYELDGHFFLSFFFFENHFLSLTNHQMDQRELPFARVCQISAFFLCKQISQSCGVPSYSERQGAGKGSSLSLYLRFSYHRFCRNVQPRLSETLLPSFPFCPLVLLLGTKA